METRTYIKPEVSIVNLQEGSCLLEGSLRGGITENANGNLKIDLGEAEEMGNTTINAKRYNYTWLDEEWFLSDE